VPKVIQIGKHLLRLHLQMRGCFLRHSVEYKLTADLDSRLAYPRPRPRLSSFKTKTKTQDLQDQYWKSMTGMDCDKQKVMASRKSSILVVAHSKQQKITPRLTTVLFQQLLLIIAVYQTLARTHNISKV